jgi:predicted ATP-grasp superfamily ATP-dependent carboligase
MKILVTDGDYKHTLGIVRSLGSKGLRVSVLARKHGELATRSKFCADVEFRPELTIANCASVVSEILRGKRHDLVIPVGYATTLALARKKKEIASLSRMETAEFAQIELAADKKRVRERALELGLHAPETVYPGSFREAREWADALEYPLILKPVVESLAKAIRRVDSRAEMLAALEALESLNPQDVPMLQRFIAGYGCGLFALYQRGVCKRIFMHRRIRENPPEGGGSCCAESFYDPALQEAGTRLLDSMNWHGVAMVEFRYDVAQKKYMLLEVNPKFWGSLDLALCAGVDFPHYLCQMAAGDSLTYSEEYRRPLRYHWPLSGEIQHLVKRPSAFLAIAADTLNPLVRSNFWLSDFRPNVREFSSLCGSLRRKVLRG